MRKISLKNLSARNLVLIAAATIVLAVLTAGFIAYQNKPNELPPILTPTLTPLPTATPTASIAQTTTSSPTPTQTTQLIPQEPGIIQFYITDTFGNPLNNAIIVSTIEPDGMNTLFDLTNSTGHLTFYNLKAGDYSFQISKVAYQSIDQRINSNGKTLSLSITLLTDSSAETYIEKIVIPRVSYDISSKTLTIDAKSISKSVLPLASSIIVKDSSEKIVCSLGISTITPSAPENMLSYDTLYTITSTPISTGLGEGTYTVTLVTGAGGSYVSIPFAISE